MPNLTEAEKDRLKELAKKATHGERAMEYYIVSNKETGHELYQCYSDNDLHFLYKCTPEAVKALLEELEELKAEREHLPKLLEMLQAGNVKAAVEQLQHHFSNDGALIDRFIKLKSAEAERDRMRIAVQDLLEMVTYGRTHTAKAFQEFIYGRPGQDFVHASIHKAGAALTDKGVTKG